MTHPVEKAVVSFINTITGIIQPWIHVSTKVADQIIMKIEKEERKKDVEKES